MVRTIVDVLSTIAIQRKHNADIYIISYKLPPQNKMYETYLDFKLEFQIHIYKITYLVQKQYSMQQHFDISLSNKIH